MTSADSLACIVCTGTRWTELPDPGPQSMASDWRIVAEPLAKFMCDRCGLVRRAATIATGRSLYERGYGLYAHAPGDPYERARQETYARWIGSAVDTTPARVLDVGCGNGSLLLALRAHWPAAVLLGCDPSAESVAHGPAQGLRLWRGTTDDLPAQIAADLVIAVNVIEHTPEPLEFLRRLRSAMAPGGRVVLICPDGSRPNLELLFADHLFSFTPGHLRALLPRAGLKVEASSTAPAALGDFQMVTARPAEEGSRPPVSMEASREGRVAYLQRWRLLDAGLQQRLHAPAVCFGAGETAGLLRAYAPRSWNQVRACTVDGASSGTFGALPLISLDAVAPNEAVLLGVRPRDQSRVAGRLRSRFSRVVTWYDLVDDAPRD